MKKNITFTVDENKIEKLKMYATLMNSTSNMIVNNLINDFLVKNKIHIDEKLKEKGFL